MSTGYVMGGERETERLAFKTEHLLLRRHLSWTGLRPGESFVDFGCGTGEVVAEAARINAGAPVAALDADEERLEYAATECRHLGAPGVRFVCARINGPGSSGLADDTFDHAWSRFLLEYVPAPAEAVREMARVVRPGGKVTLIDIEGNCSRHFGMDADLRRGVEDVLADLATTGFDPDAGASLAAHVAAAGLTGIRHEIEPYHRIVGRPDARTAAAWRLKLQTIRESYLERLFPQHADGAWVFDGFLDFLMRDDTMTWSLLHLVQGTKPV
jgi:ubiquinone/menaquinone biosynthesis C-methylase UbiE